jgi:hypothetical protein
VSPAGVGEAAAVDTSADEPRDEAPPEESPLEEEPEPEVALITEGAEADELPGAFVLVVDPELAVVLAVPSDE